MGEAETLTCHTTNRDGYREYKIDLKICADCSTRHLCTHSKDWPFGYGWRSLLRSSGSCFGLYMPETQSTHEG